MTLLVPGSGFMFRGTVFCMRAARDAFDSHVPCMQTSSVVLVFGSLHGVMSAFLSLPKKKKLCGQRIFHCGGPQDHSHVQLVLGLHVKTNLRHIFHGVVIAHSLVRTPSSPTNETVASSAQSTSFTVAATLFARA